MARRSKIIDRDLGWRDFVKRMREAKGAHVKVGVTAELGEKPKRERFPSKTKPPTLVEVAFWNEFGTKRAPERSFIRSTHDKNRGRISVMKRKLASMIMAGKMTVHRALKILGQWMQGEQVKTIDRLRTPPNAPSTIARKGSKNPLVDLAQLKQSIRYMVVIPRARLAGVGRR